MSCCCLTDFFLNFNCALNLLLNFRKAAANIVNLLTNYFYIVSWKQKKCHLLWMSSLLCFGSKDYSSIFKANVRSHNCPKLNIVLAVLAFLVKMSPINSPCTFRKSKMNLCQTCFWKTCKFIEFDWQIAISLFSKKITNMPNKNYAHALVLRHENA